MTRTTLAIAFLCCAAAQGDSYREALEKFQRKQYQEALPLAEAALSQNPGDAARIHLYGLIQAALRRLEPAEENLRKAVALAPNQSTYQFDLGYLLHQEKRYSEALPVLKRAVELDPENLLARFALARTYVLSFHELKIPNFVDLTLEQLSFIAKEDPRFPGVHHHLALVYINTGEQAKARDELRTELRYHPESTQARLELGETLVRLNEYRQAIEELEIAARQAPQVYSIYYALAKAYKADGQKTQALEAARKSVELNPGFADGQYLLGQLYRDSGQPDLAKQHLEAFRRLKSPPAP
ncbi:MAG TPA: tetratricopeptide repeat protein [Bryobacteraceae bacterium]|nr:tetratricopeptide repeat protein [Bryobacteraceae bacterium]